MGLCGEGRQNSLDIRCATCGTNPDSRSVYLLQQHLKNPVTVKTSVVVERQSRTLLLKRADEARLPAGLNFMKSVMPSQDLTGGL